MTCALQINIFPIIITITIITGHYLDTRDLREPYLRGDLDNDRLLRLGLLRLGLLRLGLLRLGLRLGLGDLLLTGDLLLLLNGDGLLRRRRMRLGLKRLLGEGLLFRGEELCLILFGDELSLRLRGDVLCFLLDCGL